MICDSFNKLTVIEKRDFIGSLAHAAMNDEECFKCATRLLNYAQRKGILDGVIHNPEPIEEEIA